MNKYNQIEKVCQEQSELISELVDEFLINDCAENEGLNKLFARKLARFRPIVNKMPERWPFWVMSQYVAFRLFRENGFAGKYLNHPEMHTRSEEEKEFLSFQIEHPWKFTFCSVKGNPSPDFYEMVDVLTNEEFLLYSTGLTEVLEQHGPMQMFFYLIGYNGKCWQTYGPHAYFRGIIPSDLLFFAQELDPNIVFMNEIPQLIDRDPLPWTLLWKSGEIPLSIHGEDLVIINYSEYHEEDFEPEKFEKDFKIKRKHPLYKMSLKNWEGVPHFSACFYHKKKNRLIMNALSDRGYIKLVETFQKNGYRLPANPEVRVTVTMLEATKAIFGRDIQLNPYEKAFSEPVNPEQQEELKKINGFLKILMEAHNSGKKIDIDKYASEAGIDVKTARDLAGKVMKKFE